MNLAAQDIRHNLGRFALTALGIGLLLMLVLGMSGIYQGLVFEATQLVDEVGADFWVVQKNTRGPFAEVSRLPANLEFRLLAVPGVRSAQSFVAHTIQREQQGRPLRMFVQGLAWPDDKGEWLPLTGGRPLGQAHYEMIADQILGLALGDKVPLGKDVFTVVGVTKGMASSAGDGTAFFTVRDALAIQFDLPGETMRLERAARRHRAANQDFGRVQPELLERAGGPSSALPALATPLVSAILVKVAPGTDTAAVVATVSAWPDVTVHTHEGQRQLLLRGNVDRARRQLGLFRVILVFVSTIIMALIIYTLTLDKTHDIAMLKLMGARHSVVVGLILQQALLLGALGYAIAYYIGQWLYPLFPRRVMITPDDLWMLAGIVLAISVAASLLGIWKAMRVEPNKVLS
ncbi:MAG: ABC transporter permease [Verrucomicrobia bacterium]|nr:ABC transporter permease [Verrucomicrobiota bacterium]